MDARVSLLTSLCDLSTAAGVACDERPARWASQWHPPRIGLEYQTPGGRGATPAGRQDTAIKPAVPAATGLLPSKFLVAQAHHGGGRSDKCRRPTNRFDGGRHAPMGYLRRQRRNAENAPNSQLRMASTSVYPCRSFLDIFWSARCCCEKSLATLCRRSTNADATALLMEP